MKTSLHTGTCAAAVQQSGLCDILAAVIATLVPRGWQRATYELSLDLTAFDVYEGGDAIAAAMSRHLVEASQDIAAPRSAPPEAPQGRRR